jgi:hypothetical protein
VKVDLRVERWPARLIEMLAEMPGMLVAKLVVLIEKLAARLAGLPEMHSDLPVGSRPGVRVLHFEDEALEGL